MCSTSLKVVLYFTDEGCAASVPELPGCWTQGADADEAIAKVREAIRDYLSALGVSVDPAVDVVICGAGSTN